MRPLSYHLPRRPARCVRRIVKLLRRTALERRAGPVNFTVARPAHPNAMTELLAEQPAAVALDEMQRVFDEVKTPFKYGIVLRGDEGKAVDCPNVFRFGDA